MKHKISLISAYSDNNDGNKSINDRSKSRNKNRQSSKNNPQTDEWRSVTVLWDSLLNDIIEKGSSHDHRLKIVKKPRATSERTLKLMTKSSRNQNI